MDYRELLREELVGRCRKNPAYSARAMARDIGLSPAFLSQILSERKSLGEERAFHIAEKMGWKHRKRKLFVGLVRLSNTDDVRVRETLREELRPYQEREVPFQLLEGEALTVLAKWYHYAILELLDIPGAPATPRWIARKLGLTPLEVGVALARLEALGLVAKREGKFASAKKYTTTNDAPSAAVRRYHVEMLERAKRAILDHEVESRNVSGITMAIDPERLPEAYDRIRRFRRELMDFLACDPKRAVYHVSLQLFRLDRDLDETVG